MKRDCGGRSEMTIEEMMADPLVALMLQADGICSVAFAKFLQATAEDFAASGQRRLGVSCAIGHLRPFHPKDGHIMQGMLPKTV